VPTVNLLSQFWVGPYFVREAGLYLVDGRLVQVTVQHVKAEVDHFVTNRRLGRNAHVVDAGALVVWLGIIVGRPLVVRIV
jgi:hypothetical protein